MRNSTAYIIAGVISLASLPMYLQIYRRSHPDQPAPLVRLPIEPMHVARYVRVSTTPVLAADQRCIAYMVVTVKGNSYTPIKEQGAIVPCHGRTRDRAPVRYAYVYD